MKENFFSLFEGTLSLINSAVGITIALAIVGLMWGIVKMLFQSGNAIAQKEAKSFMLYGVFTIFVMTSVWGLVNLLSGAITPVTQDENYTGDINNYSEEVVSPEEQFPSIQDASDIFNNNEEQRAI